jgi:hypothetical protein
VTWRDEPLPLPGPRTWLVTHYAQPWSVNDQVTWHWATRHAHVKAWRQAFALLARQHRLPRLQRAHIGVQVVVAGTSRLPDAGNCFYAAKAAVDGLVDAFVLPGDSPRFMRSLSFDAPTRGTTHSLTIAITEATE